ncbi:MAG: hypothetical protein KR126chlam6_01111 [Candidatus Anoxychlamydiales bacterium]|nr:hypothetical protein [Candidatus Anoxychlamydiales bacterium]
MASSSHIKIIQKDGSYIPLDEDTEYSVLFNPSWVVLERDFFLFNNSTETKKTNILPQTIIKK